MRRRNDDAENLLLPYYRSFYVCIQEGLEKVFRGGERKKKEKAYVQYILAFLLARTATYICRYLTKYVFAQ